MNHNNSISNNISKIQAYLFLFLINITTISCDQKNNEYFLDLNRQKIYHTHFLTERNDKFWTGDDGLQRAKILNGEYHFKSSDTIPRFNAPFFIIKENENFEIETSLIASKNDPLKFYGLLMGTFNDGSVIAFQINDTGNIRIDHNKTFYEGNFNNNVAAFKKLTIRKVSGRIKFFLNEDLIYSYHFTHKLNNLRAGPITDVDLETSMDYITIDKIITD
ncbi:hypothetical protein [Owenweeksia hongkongensis]|uniref:hypothetical protein n=1 Tax=Owenweeksia hongkongensis TaxID=253245 RepID=UPI003A949450